MTSDRRWTSGLYERNPISNTFHNEHPSRSQTGRHRHTSGLSRYPSDRSPDITPSYSDPYRSRSHNNRSGAHNNHADSVSLGRHRTRDSDYYSQDTEHSHHSSRHHSQSGSLGNSLVHSQIKDRDRDKDRNRDRDKDRYRDRDRDYYVDRIRDREGRSYRDGRSSKQRSRENEYSHSPSDPRMSESNDYSYSSYTERNGRRYNKRGSPGDKQARDDRAYIRRMDRGRDGRNTDKGFKDRPDMRPNTDLITNPSDLSTPRKFLLTLGIIFSLTSYILLVLVARTGWKAPNFYFELFFYAFILISMLLYSFNVRYVVNFLIENFPVAASQKGQAVILAFISLRSWPRSWPAVVTNQIEIYIVGNVFSLVSLIAAIALHFIE